MPSNRTTKARHFAEYVVAGTFLSAIRILPFRLRTYLGSKIIGGLITHLGKFRHRIANNLGHVYPDMSDAEIHRITGAVGNNFGRTFSEYLANSSYKKQQQLFHASGPGLEALKDAQSAGKGVLLVSGHFGQWEAMRHYLNAQGIKVGAIYRPNSNAYFDRLYLRNIETAGPIFPTGRQGMANMVKYLRQGGVVGILVDQNVPKGMETLFLGRSALTSDSTAKIALKLGIPAIPCYGTRRENNRDIDIEFEAPVPHTDAKTMTQAFNDSLSDRIQKNPGQWYWLHRRWGKLD